MPGFTPHVIQLARNINSAVKSSATISSRLSARGVKAVLPKIPGDLLAPLLPKTAEQVTVIRPDDLLAITLVFHNLRLNFGEQRQLVRTLSGKPSYLAMEIQGQHFGEEALLDPDAIPSTSEDFTGLPKNDPPPLPHVLRARLAYPSRIVVKMPETRQSLDYRLDAILDAFTEWELSLDPLARSPRIRSREPMTETGSVDLGELIVEASDTLKRAVNDLDEALTVANLKPLVREIQSRARQAAARAGAVLRTGTSAVDITREEANALKSELARNRRLNAETRELATALFEVSVGVGFAREVARSDVVKTALTAEQIAAILPSLIVFLVPHEPNLTSTALELPYRLIQSPHQGSTFEHPSNLVTLSNRTEIWRTILRQRSRKGPQPIPASGTPFTVMWSPDYIISGTTGMSVQQKRDPFMMSLTPDDRDELVRLMSGYIERVEGKPYRPRAARARDMKLSSLGGTLDADGSWSILPDGVEVESWQHVASYGRDQYVRVDRAGYLFPFGHRAALVSITERKVSDQNPSGSGAFLRKTFFIVLREFDKLFPATNQVFGGRKLPFTRLTCLTRRTPKLQQKEDPNGSVAGLLASQAHWPILLSGSGADPAQFEFEAIDLAGRRTVFSSRAIFVSKSFVDNSGGLMHKVHSGYTGTGSSINERSCSNFSGQTLRMAPVGDGSAGDVDIPADELIWEGTVAASQKPPFHPAIRYARAQLKALKGVTGKSVAEMVEFEPTTYLPHGYVNNPWKVFLQLKTPFKVDMGGDVPTDKVGGIGQPTQSLSAISNGQGAVSGSVGALTGGSVQPDDMFPEAKILGGFDLKDLIAPFVATGLGKIPGFKTEEKSDRIITSWEYKNESVNSPIPGIVTGQGGNSALELGAKLTAFFTYPDPDLGYKNKDGDPAPDFGAGTDPGWKDPEIEATGKLTNFKLNFFGFVIVWFDEFSFKSTLKNKFDPKPKLHDDHPVVFGGPLEFVNKLSELIPSGGFSDPPIIKPTLTDLQVGYDFNLPDVAVGVFAIKNMKIGAILTIPFTGDPVALKIFFNTREAPFLLTVCMFGGGGFFALVTTAEGIQEVEAAFEFGAFAEFDCVVASGGIYIKGGVYFHWKTDAVTLEAYVEMGGELSVLGLISASITLHLSLGYYKENSESYLRGQAKLVIEVEILFFSASVEIKVERRFAGSDADPTFAQVITDQSVWSDYCAAYA
ncbi:MAG: hypothetical protein IH612_18240 [Desulfofustis sp.]|nr:hypothetical protein [Desulfofustis sp.]